MRLLEFIDGFIIPHEGTAWENDPDDSGNAGDGVTDGNLGTKYGVDAASHPGINIRDLTLAQAESIYLVEYSRSLAGMLPWPLSAAFFDVHVNNGEHEAICILQRAVGTTADGLVNINPPGETIQAVQATDPLTLALSIPEHRDVFYADLAQEKPTDRKYLNGWENRDADLKTWLRSNA